MDTTTTTTTTPKTTTTTNTTPTTPKTKPKPIYQCHLCNRIMGCKRNLKWHIYNVCKFEHKCTKCNIICKSKNYLTVHMEKCIGDLKCPKCAKILSRKQTYLKHVAKCTKV